MKKVLIQAAAVLATFLFVLGNLSCQRNDSGTTETIVISYAPFETLALLWTAEEKNFFTHNGIKATLHQYDTGAGSLDAVLKGEADIAVGPAEFPLVANAFKKEKIRAIASIDKIEFIYIVARKDRGIKQISDLKGKRIGTTIGTVAEFYLGRFLELNGMTMKDVISVDLRSPAEWVNTVVNGDVDAISTTQPSVNKIIESLGANAVVWPAQSNRPMYALIIARDEWITGHPQLINKFLKALAEAERFFIHNPAEAKAIIQKQQNLDSVYVDTIWSQNQYGLTLDMSLIAAMEDEARWMIKNNLTSEKEVPNFSDYIYETALKAVKPEAVNIIR